MNNSHRVIIDLSQDDSDNNDVYMDVVEILDSPVPLTRSTHYMNDVELFTQQVNNHSIHHSPLSVTQNSLAITYPMTAHAFSAQQEPPRSTTATVKTNSGSNGHQSHLRQRNTGSQNQNSFRLNASTNVPVSDSIQLPNTEGHNGTLFNQTFHQQISTPIHHYSHRQTNHTHNNNSSNTRATTGTTTGHSPSQNDFSRGPPHSPNTNRHNHHGRRRNNRRRGYGGTSAARRGNQASPPHQTFAIIHQLAQDQLLRRHDGNINYYHYHHRHHHDDGRLLNIDNLSYEELLSIFGNGSENCGAPVTDISLLPVVTVTMDDIFKSETTADGCSNHEQTDMNSNKYCCSICLENYEIGDQKKILPCFHNFHEKCADQWLIRNGSCPICKHRLNQSLVET